MRPEVTTQFVRGACQAGANVRYVTLKGKGGHGWGSQSVVSNVFEITGLPPRRTT